MDIEITSGGAARALLDEPAFQERWRALAARDPKLTLFQEPAFVLSWLDVYAASHEPWVVSATTGDGALGGLLCLARRQGDGALRHVGGEQAEYHGWIAAPELEPDFVVEAVAALRARVGLASWSWRWCPPGSPLGWWRDPRLRAAGVRVAAEVRPAPIWDLRDRADVDRILRARAIRGKRNRYARSGGLRLERVRCPDRTRELLPLLARQCDFRQEVVNGVRPFADDAHKLAFYAHRQQWPEANHFTVLWHGDAPIAFHFGACDGRTCQLGLSAFDPSESRGSPGTLLIAELGRMLAEEGYERLDLTPGTDPYKQRFATGEEERVRVVLHGSGLRAGVARASRSAVGTAQRWIAGRELATQDRLARVQRTLRSARRDGSRRLAASLARRVRNERRYHCLVRSADAQPPGSERPPRPTVQDWSSLVERGPAPGFPSRRARLSDALDRFADGQQLHQCDAGAGPALLGWRVPRVRGALRQGLEQMLGTLEGREVWEGFEGPGLDAAADPSERGRAQEALAELLRAMLHDAVEAEGNGVVLCLPAQAGDAVRVARELGFEDRGMLVRSERLGRVQWRGAPVGGEPAGARELHYVSHAAVPSGEANSVQVVKMCAAFAPHFDRVVLYGRETPEPSEGVFERYGVEPVFSLVRIGSRRIKLVSRIGYSLQLLRALRTRGARGLLYGRDYHSLALSVLLGSPRLPIVFEAHQPPDTFVQRFLVGRLVASRRLARIVVISQALADELVRRFGERVRGRITVAPDGADAPGTVPPPRRRAPGEGLQIGYVGSLYPGKGMERIEALAALMPDATFHVIGGKPDDLDRWRARLTAGNVRFHGHLPHAEAQARMAGFDVLLAPYRAQVLLSDRATDIGRWMSPLKIFEYMASGRPMVVSDLPVIREVLEDGRNALLADPEDTADWVARLRELEADPALGAAIAERAGEDLEDRYTWQRRAESILHAVPVAGTGAGPG